MTTQYSMSDVLPKDATGLPFNAPVEVGSSQLDFVLQAAVATSVSSAKKYGHLGVGTHAQSGSMTSNGPGVALLGLAGTPMSVGGNLQVLWLTTEGAVNTVPRDSYTLVSTGSTAASADTAHRLYGTYNGLSALNSSVVFYVSAWAQTNDAAIFYSNAKSGRGFILSTSATQYSDLPPMKQTAAVDLHFANKTAGANATVNWFIYRRD